ncbi:MAG: DNA polymerase [Pseudomonadota bacterium]
MAADPQPIDASPRIDLRLRTKSGEFRKSSIWVERDNFYGHSKNDKNEAYIIVGFDTEYKTPDKPVTLEELKAGQAKYTVLSYQVHCSVYDPAQPDAVEWSAIAYPDPGDRIKLSELLTLAFSQGIQSGSVRTIPTRVYMVGHFTRADVPAFADFKDLTEQISAVRSTFVSISKHILVNYAWPDHEPTCLMVILRDTMLLTPATSKSLWEIGRLVGVPKITLDPDPAQDLYYKGHMDELLRDRPDLFELYAINDAIICVKYLQRLIAMYHDIFGVRSAPATLTAIGVDLLQKSWEENLKIDKLDVIGKESVTIAYYSKRLRLTVKKKQKVDLEAVSFHLPLATECYHGGRGEQFWFGPAFEDDWTDYDLSGAYPTGMALIGYPDWRNIRPSTNVKDYTADVLGVASVEFEFPKSVRFPTMPVRSDNGLVFPRKGRSNCAAPEIALARSLGASVKILYGVIVPTDSERPVFRDFIRDCVAKRQSYDKGTLDNLFWKELSNSSYGKTAQGLRAKRVFDLRDQEMKPLPPSKITNPFFAAFITSFVRAALGEVMNALPSSVCVFSCTTDGFLTNATADQIAEASRGQVCSLYRNSRDMLTGDPTVLEIKHQVRQPLGWRTRGQATLIEGRTAKGDGVNIVLAKGGIYTPAEYDSDRLQNEFVTKLFLSRTPEDRIQMATKTGIRDMIFFDADLVEKDTSKRLNMEFDWKRKPYAAWDHQSPAHLAFTTDPWDNRRLALRDRYASLPENDCRLSGLCRLCFVAISTRQGGCKMAEKD